MLEIKNFIFSLNNAVRLGINKGKGYFKERDYKCRIIIVFFLNILDCSEKQGKQDKWQTEADYLCNVTAQNHY